jgi:ribosome-interacting GTPase 1
MYMLSQELMEEVWHRCNMIRIYTKPQGQIPDYEEPVILHSNNPTVEEFCNRLHKGIMAEFNFGEFFFAARNALFLFWIKCLRPVA